MVVSLFFKENRHQNVEKKDLRNKFGLPRLIYSCLEDTVVVITPVLYFLSAYKINKKAS